MGRHTFGPLRLAALLVLGAALTAFTLRSPAEVSPRFNHVMLYVSDLDASIAFYTEAFDLEVTDRLDALTFIGPDGSEASTSVQMAFLRFPGQDFVLELSEQQVEDDGTSPYFQHIGVDVTDIEAAAARVQSAGGRDFSGVRTVRARDLVARNAFFLGPDGEMVELMQMLQGTF